MIRIPLDGPEEDGAPSGSMIDGPAIVVTNADHSVLDVGAPFVADHAAGSPHRPLISTGVDGDAISDELGLNPGVNVKGSEASVAEAEMICDSGRGLELALPNVDPYAGDPLSDDYGILQSPDHHLPCCSKASCAPVGPSSGWAQIHDPDAPQVVLTVNCAAVLLGFSNDDVWQAVVAACRSDALRVC
ncbi:hypothetical protein Nepgr_023080 [Nepenthes gracilis]|uniref:Uncharacterized protein n=1 Tax=Nepenthes gracilis TaxID=150966 RepID=A0AAD3XXK5_NEPGR|nr:hypothetical protein Nepgr_023080 [Nepenthes gracilis]